MCVLPADATARDNKSNVSVVLELCGQTADSVLCEHSAKTAWCLPQAASSGAANHPSLFTIMKKAFTKAFSWFKAVPTSTFKLKTL